MGEATAGAASRLRIGIIFPEVLGTYGDGGNARVLAARAEMRGIPAEIVTVSIGSPIPASLDIYTLGGGEDTAQALVGEQVKPGSGLHSALAAGAPLLAICAGMQVLGHWYEDASGKRVSGLGLLDCTTVPRGSRAIGELVSEPIGKPLRAALTGFENHGGATHLGPEARPLGRVRCGFGNDGEVEGCVQGSIIATYMHGPALARNPELADLLLARAVGSRMESLEISEVDELRRERLHAAFSPKDPH